MSSRKKKIHPKEQTKEIRKARYEFMMRNPKQKSSQEEIINLIRSTGQKISLKEGLPENLVEKQIQVLTDLLKEDRSIWAAFDGQPELIHSLVEVYNRINEEEKTHPGYIHSLEDSNGQMEQMWMWEGEIENDAERILKELLFPLPYQKRIIIINLERTKEAIMAEVEKIVTDALKEYQEVWSKVPLVIEDALSFVIPSNLSKLGFSDEKVDKILTNRLKPYQSNNEKDINFASYRKKERLKWLPIYKELLEVWDLYSEAGQQPWQKTFPQISRKVGRPLSTVKDQWYMAYEKIYGEKYKPETKYSTEEKRGDADKLCASCPHGAKCYRGNDWHPCRDYLAIAGKEKNLEVEEYKDNIDYSKPNPRKSRKIKSD